MRDDSCPHDDLGVRVSLIEPEPVTPVAYPFNKEGDLELHHSYAQARESEGLLRVQLPFGEPAWLATRHADARAVLGDPRFSRNMALERDEPRLSAGRLISGVMTLDPPDHSRVRGLVMKAFTGQRVERLRPRVRDMANDLLDKMIAAGPPGDLVEDFALPIPVIVICELLGVPVEHHHRFRGWSDAFMSTSTLSEQEMLDRFLDMRAYIKDLVDGRRAQPADDLMSALIEVQETGDRLSELELIDLCIGILVAGHESTASQIPNFIIVLLQHPDVLKQLANDPSLLPAAVEELTRWVPTGSGAAFARYAREDVEISGTLVRAGEPVMVSLAAANRDIAEFADPERFDITRERNHHLAYGHGPHHCMGVQLARIELQESIGALIERMPTVELLEGALWKENMLMRGPYYLPVTW